jgi:Nodulin-like
VWVEQQLIWLLLILRFVNDVLIGKDSHSVFETHSQFDHQVHNFRAHRGLTMGMTSAAVSLCGLVFSQINDHFYKGDDDTYGFLIFMALVISIGQIAGSFTVRSFKHDHEASHPAAASDNDEETPLLTAPKDEEPDLSGWQFFTDPIGFSLFLALFVLLGVG